MGERLFKGILLIILPVIVNYNFLIHQLELDENYY